VVKVNADEVIDMGKISPVAAKYIIKAEIKAKGIVEKPDVIGAIFGQTEGLLGPDLELRELQKSGRIGRIEVQLETKNGRVEGIIEIPSSMDKAETAIIAAAIETIDRVGPCEAEIRVIGVEDVREKKREYIMERAKEILKNMLMKAPDSQEIVEKVTETVRQAEITEYGPERLPAGPAIDSSEEIIVVEGRADVLNLLKYGFKNVIGMGGAKVPKTIIELSKSKTVTLFVDGDRGGDIIIKEALMAADIDYIARAPAGKEVEELTKKEIHKALRTRESAEQVKQAMGMSKEGVRVKKKKVEVSEEKAELFKKLLEDLVGTRGAYLLRDTEVLGKVPLIELSRYLEILKADTVVMDGIATRKIIGICKSHGVELIVARDVEKGVSGVITEKDLEGKE